MDEGQKLLNDILPFLDGQQGETIKKAINNDTKPLSEYIRLTLNWNIYISYKSYYG